MSLSTEHLARGRVLHSGEVTAVAADLSSVNARSARALVVSPELVEFAKQEGFAAGFDEGHAAGYADGIGGAQRHTELLSGLVQRLNNVSEELLARETTARLDLEDQIVAAAFQIAAVLVGRELEHTDERGRDAIARALALAPEQGLVNARLNPADVALIDPDSLSLGRALNLIADPSVVPGDCIVDVGACRIDARIEEAMIRIREILA